MSIFFRFLKKIEFARNFYMALSSAEKEHLARVLAQDRQALIFNDFEVRGGEERAQPRNERCAANTPRARAGVRREHGTGRGTRPAPGGVLVPLRKLRAPVQSARAAVQVTLAGS